MRKHIFTLMALMAALCACNKEQFNESDVTNPVVETRTPLVFTATMESTSGTKATLDGLTPSWEIGDQVNINGFYYGANAAGSSTTFGMSGDGRTREIRPTFVSSTNEHSLNDSNPASNLVDDIGVDNRWCASKEQQVGGVWNIVVSTGKPTHLKIVKVYNYDNQTYPKRRWKALKVYGSISSTDGWEELISVDNLNLAINNRGLAGEIEIGATKEYTFYKVDVSDVEGDDWMQMSDMKFVVSYDLRPTFVSTTTPGSYGDNPPSNLVDDAGTSTRWIAKKDQRQDGVWNIVVSTGSPTLLNTVKLWNADNASDNAGRRWKEIEIAGRLSDSDAWRTFKTFDDLELEANDYGLAGELEINSSKPYTFYRINVLDNEGDKDGYMQMSDMKFAVDPSAPYNAYFPASLCTGEQTVLPSTVLETWADGKFNMPMYAQSNTTDLEFKNLCGVLKITIKRADFASVKSIRISSDDKAISGEFTVSNNTAVLTSPDTKANTFTVTYTNAVATTDAGTVFYVAIPAQTYKRLKIELSSNGSSYTKSMTTKKNVDITVERNKIYPITFATLSTKGSAYATGAGCNVNWVQLWENGPRFAEMNVGATSPTGYGDFNAMYPNDDRATELWGANWCLPSNGNLNGLFNSSNCIATWYNDYNGTGVAGMEFKGKGEYSDNSIFLPASGYAVALTTTIYDRNKAGYYYSSNTFISTGTTRLRDYLRFDKDSHERGYSAMHNCYIRPVLAE